MFTGDNEQGDGVSITPSSANTNLDPELLNLGESVKGINELATETVGTLEEGIVFVDQAMQNVVNQMGQGEVFAKGIKKEIAEAAPLVTLLGGTTKEALAVQQDTLTAFGRNILLSSQQIEELYAVNKVTGVSVDKLEEGFLNAGMSLTHISEEMLTVRETANSLGVNAKAVSATVVQNLDKLNKYTFQGGVEGLAKMAARAQALRYDMSQTFALADKAMSPESAIEMSSALQRLGGAAGALADPLKLMDLAQNDVGELQNQLGQMFKTYTAFDEKTGKFEIMPGARRQLKEIASELGIDYKEVEKLALGTADLDKKLSEISFTGINIDDETKEMVANMSTMGKGGEYVIKVKDEATGELIERNTKDLMEEYAGRESELAKILQDQKAAEDEDPQKAMVRLAQAQLDELSAMRKQADAVKIQPGMAAGASEGGAKLLEVNRELANLINEPLIKELGANGPLYEAFNKLGTNLEAVLGKISEAKKTDDAGERKKLLLDAAALGKETAKEGFSDTKKIIGDILLEYGETAGLSKEEIESLGKKIQDTVGGIKIGGGEPTQGKGEPTEPTQGKGEPLQSELMKVNVLEVQQANLSGAEKTDEKISTEVKNLSDNLQKSNDKVSESIVDADKDLAEYLKTDAVGTTATLTAIEEKKVEPTKLEPENLRTKPFEMEVGPAMASEEGIVTTDFEKISEVQGLKGNEKIEAKPKEEEKPEDKSEEKGGILKSLKDSLSGLGNVGDVVKNAQGLANMDPETIATIIESAGEKIAPDLIKISQMEDKGEQTKALQELMDKVLNAGNALEVLGTENKFKGKLGEGAGINEGVTAGLKNVEGLNSENIGGITELLNNNMSTIIDSVSGKVKEVAGEGTFLGKLGSKFGFDPKLIDEYTNMAKDMAETTDLDSDQIKGAFEGKTIDVMGAMSGEIAAEEYVPTDSESLGSKIEEYGKTKEEEGKPEEKGLTTSLSETAGDVFSNVGLIKANKLEIQESNLTSALKEPIDNLTKLNSETKEEEKGIVAEPPNTQETTELAATEEQGINPVEAVQTEQETAELPKGEEMTTEITSEEPQGINPVEAAQTEQETAELPKGEEMTKTLAPVEVGPPKGEETVVAAVTEQPAEFGLTKIEEKAEEKPEEKGGLFSGLKDMVSGFGNIGNVVKNAQGLANMDPETIATIIESAGEKIAPDLIKISEMQDKGEQSKALQDLMDKTLTAGNALEVLGTENKFKGKLGEGDGINEGVSAGLKNIEGINADNIGGITEMLNSNMSGIIDNVAGKVKNVAGEDTMLGKLGSKFGFDAGQIDDYANMAKDAAKASELDSEQIAGVFEGKTLDITGMMEQGGVSSQEGITPQEITAEEFGGVEQKPIATEETGGVGEFMGGEPAAGSGGASNLTVEPITVTHKVELTGVPASMDIRQLEGTMQKIFQESQGMAEVTKKMIEGAGLGLRS
jgi:hypothetical protein